MYKVLLVMSTLSGALISGLAQAQDSTYPYTTGYRYDPSRRVTGVISPDPGGSIRLPHSAVRNTYDAVGRLIRFEKGALTAWQPTEIAPANWSGFDIHQTIEAAYYRNGRKVVETLWSSGVRYQLTQYSYDALGRLLCMAVRMDATNFGSAPTNACKQTDTVSTDRSKPDRITRNEYDAVGPLLKVQKAYGVTVANGYPATLQQDYASYTYTANSKRASVTDANGNRAEMVYDGFDRQVAGVFPAKTNGTVAASCNIGTITEVNGVSGPSEARSAADDCEKYAYDRNGNRATLIKRDGRVIRHTYDALNRITVKTVPGSPTVHYAYDLRGLQTEARFDSLSGPGVSNRYDGLGRLTSSVTNMGGVGRTLSFQHDANGNRTQVMHPDGVRFDMVYDGVDRLKGASWMLAGQSAATPFLAITYNALGQRQDVNRGSSYTGYNFDGVLRLINQDQRFAGGVGNTTSAIGYNPANQMTSRTRSNDDFGFKGYVNVNRSYAVNGLNQYTTGGPASFIYDANGNLTSDGSTNFVYDAENRLVQASGARTATLAYDPLGRLWQTLGGAFGTTQFLYDGDQLAAEYDGTGVMLRRYMFAGQDEPILQDEGGRLDCYGTRFLHTDHQGSIIGLADCSGNRTGVNTYDEYGIPGPRNQGRFQYTGQAWIPELGMYHYKARVYSPTLGRFLQTDPIGYDDQINLYAYVANDPVNLKDVTGERITVAGAVRPMWQRAIRGGSGDG